MAELEVRLLGKVSFRQNGQVLSFSSSKALELLCYLFVHRDRAHTREALSELLWPGRSSGAAKKYLRQALWILNRVTQTQLLDAAGQQLLVVDPVWVRVNPDASWWLDLSAFETTYAEARDTSGQQLSECQARDLESALELYQGDLMASWYQDWCGYERDRLQQTYLTMVDQLMAYCEANQLYAKGWGLGQAGLRLEPTREHVHRQLMRLHYLAGGRMAAIRQYERCVSVLREEFGVQPSAETVELYEQIRTDQVPPAAQPAATPADHGSGGAVAELHQRLDQIEAILHALHESVRQFQGLVR